MKDAAKFFHFDKNSTISLLISILISIIFAVLFSQTKLFDGLETNSVDFRFFLRDPSERSEEIMKKVEIQKINPRVNPNIIIMAVDEASMAELGSWPWPWAIHADLIKTLSISPKPPQSILFDIFFIDHKKLFSEDSEKILRENLPSPQLNKVLAFNKINELELAQAIKKSGRIFLDFPFFVERMKANIPDMPERLKIMERVTWPVPPEDTARPWVQDAAPPLMSIADGSRGIGYANIRYEVGQNVNRRLPVVVKHKDHYYPSIDLLLAMDYFHVTTKDVEIKMDDAVYLKNIPKTLMPVINSDDYPKYHVEKNSQMDLSEIFEYTFQGLAKDDSLGKAIGNAGFLTKIKFQVLLKDELSIRDLKIWMIPEKDKEAEGYLITHVEKFAVDKKKEVTLGKDVLVSFEPMDNGKRLKIQNNLGADLAGIRTQTDIMLKPNAQRVIRIPVDNEGFMMINFAGGQENFSAHSYYNFVPKPGSSAQKIREHFETYTSFESFEKKIILVAIYKALGLVDVHKSPYGPMFGIEHHANALNTILNQDFLSSLTNAQNMLIMAFIALLFGFLLPRISIVKNAIISLLGVVIYFVLAQVFFNTQSILYATAVPIIQIIITFSGITVFRVMTEEQKSKYIRSTFSKFVSKDVVNQLLSHPDRLQLGGEDREITIFFSDIRGFTTISEALTPQELVLLLNEYLSKMTDIIIADLGTLDKYMGDAIMAFWGAPLPMEDHALKACKSSLDMMAKLKEMQEIWISQGRPPINIGIGLNTGKATVGNMGSSNRMDYTCMGDTINLGSRLEGINKVYGTNIIMSEYTYHHVKDKVYARELDLIKVKGKTKPVYIYELLGLRQGS